MPSAPALGPGDGRLTLLRPIGLFSEIVLSFGASLAYQKFNFESR
jgi:hypothetical protein